MKFYAMFKGVDLDKETAEEAKDRFDAAQRRAEARLSGKSIDELEFADLGIEVETD